MPLRRIGRIAPFTENYWNYPTAADNGVSHDLIEPDPGNNATFSGGTVGDWTIGAPYYRTEVGAHENSASSYDTFDQGGNVQEFNVICIKDDSPDATSIANPDSGVPAPGTAYFYLVRYQRGQVIGPWGFGSEGAERVGTDGCATQAPHREGLDDQS
jgi:hypothetical protein